MRYESDTQQILYREWCHFPKLTLPYREFSYGEFPMRQSNFRSGATSPYGDFLYKEILYMKNSLYGEVAPLLKLDWRIGNFPMGKFCIRSSL